MTFRELSLVLVLVAAPSTADPLSEMAGEWSGSGTAREAPGRAEEAVRCRLSNEWQEDRGRLRVRGRCAVPGSTFEIDGALNHVDDGRLSGFWRNPSGLGQTSISGRISGDAAHFAFSAKDPKSGRDLSQIITMQIVSKGFRLSSRSRTDQSVMADIEFRR
jgi:hypothetical protein